MSQGETWCDRPQKRGKNTHKGLKLGPLWARLQGAHRVRFCGGPPAPPIDHCYPGLRLTLPPARPDPPPVAPREGPPDPPRGPRGPSETPPGHPQRPRQDPPRAFFRGFCNDIGSRRRVGPGDPPRGGPPGPAPGTRPPIGGAPPIGAEGQFIIVKDKKREKIRGETWCDRPHKRGKNTHKGLKLGPFWAPLQGAHPVRFWGGPPAPPIDHC
jgi:hypothetical protein